MELIYKTDNGKLIQGDNIEIMEKIKDNTYDSGISDFPYDLKFMGKKWDNTGDFYKWCKTRAIGLYRIIKPGGYVCIFGHPKTNHRMKCAFEDAGFNIVEEIDWIYGTGFPKNQDIGKLFDKQNGRCLEERYKMAIYIKQRRKEKGYTLKELNEIFGYVAGCTWWESTIPNTNRVPNKEDWNKLKELLSLNNDFDWIIDRFEAEREIVGKRNDGIGSDSNSGIYQLNNGESKMKKEIDITEPSTDQAKQWDGWKTSGLKPAHEPITVFQKPLEGTYINNINIHKCGAMNIDACRILTSQVDKDIINAKASKNPTTNYSDSENKIYGAYAEDKSMPANEIGRFPANIILDSSMGEILDSQSGISKSTGGKGEKSKGALGDSVYGKYKNEELATNAGGLGDVGGASRYFLKIEQEDFTPFYYCPKANKKEKGESNTHVTVKPKALIKWLIKLVTPIDGKTIDITAGSGTHGLSCEELNKEEGYNLEWINIELLNTDKEPYCKIAMNRIKSVI